MYNETLWPRFWVWLMPASFAASLGVAYGYAYGAPVGWLVGLATGAVLLGWLAYSSRTRLEVAAGELRAGRASLPVRYVGRVVALDPAQTFAARTSKADASAFLLLRPWASPRSVVLEITDEADPHPYWLVSSRRPEQFAAALIRARDTAGKGSDE